MAYSEVLGDEKGPTCAGFLVRAVDFFRAHGIDRVERLMTDNAWAYKYSLCELCAELGITQKFINPHCPSQNGKVERLNRTLQWLDYYNTRRRHSALGGSAPISRLQPT